MARNTPLINIMPKQNHKGKPSRVVRKVTKTIAIEAQIIDPPEYMKTLFSKLDSASVIFFISLSKSFLGINTTTICREKPITKDPTQAIKRVLGKL